MTENKKKFKSEQ